MEPITHNMNALFAQLGLDNSDEAIEAFIASTDSIAGDVPLHGAEFWSSSQAAFLKEAIAEDSDWSEVVDALNARLR